MTENSEQNVAVVEEDARISQVADEPSQSTGKSKRRRRVSKQAEEEKALAESPNDDAPSQDNAVAAEQGSTTKDAEGDAEDAQLDQQGAQRKRRRQNGQANNGQNRGKSANARNQSNNNNRRRNRRGNQADPVPEPSLKREELEKLKVAELRSKAAELDIDYVGLRKAALIDAIYHAAAVAEGFKSIEGILEIQNEGYGFLRTGNYMKGDNDAFVHQQLIRQYGLRTGDALVGTLTPGRSGNKYPPIGKIESINGVSPEELRGRPRFRDLTPIYPNERLLMEHGKDSITGRAIDLVAPIGKGQRGLIVSPPKAGKTTVLKHICQSIAVNNPEVHLFCLLVDERPEEVTDMQRSVRGEVVASTFDMPSDNHTAVAELVIERAKRLVEMGEDVVVVLDSITRLARAYNLAQPASGRILSGGVDSAALYPPKRFLGAARNIEGGGSLTILASALIDTGSKMDEVIFEEFKGTGNMELKLDRELADKRIFPAIDPVASGTRNEELLIDTDLQPFVWGIRMVLANMNSVERAESALVKGLKQTSDNKEFLIRSARKAQQMDYS
ncbi:MAG: transcription termination factor Rho [Coriobacteriales bacterium]|nr:transcription termination factor Rho [Coriobacteriales bacterium]